MLCRSNVTGLTLSQSVSINGQTLTFRALAGTTITGQYGTLVMDASGNYTYTPITNPGAGVTKTDSFRYTMQDTATATSSATLFITLTGSAAADPIPVANTATAVEAGGTANGSAGTDPTGNLVSDDNANGAAVRLAKGANPKKFAKGIAGHWGPPCFGEPITQAPA